MIKAIIRSISNQNEVFEIDNVPNEYYEYNAGNNLNAEYIDELCDLIEDNLPDSNSWDNGYFYVLINQID